MTRWLSLRQRAAETRGFTIIELLVVVSIIALLIGILLPAISKARDTARVTLSSTNLKNLGAAHHTYAAEWNDRQFTVVRDDFAAVGGFAYYEEGAPGGMHPPIILGWTATAAGNNDLIGYWFQNLPTNSTLVFPIHPSTRFGWFRMINARQFSRHVNGRFYDPVFYAPKDRIVLDLVESLLDAPGEFVVAPGDNGQDPPYWSSYCMSPAALFSPKVMDRDNPTLSTSVEAMPGGAFRTPGMSQARHPSLKTHMLEHHWLQSNRENSCNPAFADGTYDGCEPFYFNGAYESAPVSLFYDGHVRMFGVRESIQGDEAVVGGEGAGETGAGLYFKPGQLPQGTAQLQGDGYYNGAAYDNIVGVTYKPNFHILTADGILGRDTLGGM